MSPPKNPELADVQEESYKHASKTTLEAYPESKAMDSNELKEFLSKKIYAVLATTRPDGRAHATPIAFFFWNNSFWIASVEGTRLRNLRKNPWASIVIFEGEPPKKHQAVMAEGQVIIHEGDMMREILSVQEFSDLATKKYGRAPDWASAFVELEPKRIFSYDANKEK